MSIRPIDMQITIQKTDHYTKDFNYNNQVLNSQQDTSAETQKQVLQQQRQVVSTQSSKNKKIHRDESKKSKTKDNDSNTRKDGAEGKNHDGVSLIEDDKGAFVDITI